MKAKETLQSKEKNKKRHP